MRTISKFAFLVVTFVALFGGMTVSAQDTCESQVTVASGDTLYDIAVDCGTTIPALLTVNPAITEPDVLEVGQIVTIPTANNTMGDPVVAISPQRGAPGTAITVIANGFPVNQDVIVELLVAGDVPEASQQVRADDDGAVVTTIRVPVDTQHPRWQVVVRSEDNRFTTQSFPFFLTDDPPVSGTVFTQTQVYLVNLGTDAQDNTCDEQYTNVAVDIDATVAPLTAAIESLFSTNEYGVANTYNAFQDSDLTLSGIDIDENGLATIALTGDLVIGDVCDEVWMPAQIRRTALQYSTISDVSITYNGEVLEDVLVRVLD